MQQINPSKYECHYPLVAEDSTYHYTNCNWQYADSLRTHYAKYKDSVAYDWVWDEEAQSYKTLYTSIDGKVVVENTSYMDMQYYVVPVFIAVITATIIFAFVLLRDSEQALKQKKEDSLLDFINDKHEKI